MTLTSHVINEAYRAESERPVGLVGYVLNREKLIEPPLRQGSMFDYVLTADGLYLHAQREGLEVCFPISNCEIRGVKPLLPMFSFALPKVPSTVVEAFWNEADLAAGDNLELLGYFEHSEMNPFDDGWLMELPPQDQKPMSCRPLSEAAGMRAMIEIHSHHRMPARFSSTDNADERGFRLYAVIGRLDEEEPQIRLRVGVYGYHWEIPASWVMELPEALRDCNEMEDEP